ncbi:MAG: pitrilysin family protein [Hyphomicrobiaceae bacterium]
MTVTLSTLKSGVRVVTDEMPHLETTSLGIWVAAGSRHESEEEHGISHFLEHMAFKGTPRRTARAIAEEIEAAGGEINASTGIEATAYYARVLKGDEPLALDVLCDILTNPLLDPGEIRREAEVIAQEIAAARDLPDDVAYDLLEQTAYPGQSIGRPILGSEESVARFASADFRGYLERHYTGERIVVAAAGAIEHGRVVAEVEARLAGIRPTPAGELTLGLAPALYRGGTAIEAKSVEQSHVLLGFESPSYMSDEFYAAQVLSGLVGGGMSSRLFQEVRENRGLCYAIYSFASGFVDSGLFGIHAATAPEDVPELVDVIAREVLAVAETGPGDAELQRAKAQLKAGMLMSLESSGARAEQLARQVMAHGRVLGTEELADLIGQVSLEKVRELARRLFAGSAPTLVEVGPGASARTFERLTGLLVPSPAATVH